MRITILCVFLWFSANVIFAQKKVSKIFELTSKEIVINTNGLDNLKLENSKTNNVEIILVAESYDDQLIEIKENSEEIIINFHFEGTETREVIFRKFITKRLQRADAVIKIPENKKISIVGQNIDIQSQNIKNELEVFIENGIVTLNKIKKNTKVKLYSGNVYAYSSELNLEILSNLGKIKIDDKMHKKKYRLDKKTNSKKLLISSIKANIFLTNN